MSADHRTDGIDIDFLRLEFRLDLISHIFGVRLAVPMADENHLLLWVDGGLSHMIHQGVQRRLPASYLAHGDQMAFVIHMENRLDIQHSAEEGCSRRHPSAPLQVVQIIHGKPMAQVQLILFQPLNHLVDGFSLFDCKTVDNRGFNLPVIPAGETDENGVALGNDFTSDVSVRRAINLAINREEMIDHVLNGYGTVAYSVCDQMPWYNPAAETDYDPDMAKAILKEDGWEAGEDGILTKDGVRAEFTLMYPTGDSVRQALAEDTANQLKAFGINVTTEGVGWDTAYDRAQSTPLMWGWGAHTPMEFYNIYHTAPGKKYAEYSPYANVKVDEYMDAALAESDLEKSYELWKDAQWDGTTGITQDGDLPWIWLVNIDHLYWVKDGLQVAEQKLHPHGHGWSIVNNVDQWTWK